MNVLAHKIDEQIVDHFSYVLPYLKMPANEKAHKLKTLSKYQKTHAIKELLNIIYKNIDAYEKHRYPVEHKNPADILAFLMELHNLTQSDFPEIGTQSHLSKILNGERNLTKDQIGALSKRFGISPAVFY
jgi:HTH-type transcriptional regulator / antitoxin HigA